MSTRAPMMNRVSRKKTSEAERKARFLRAFRAVLRGSLHGAEAEAPKPVTLPYVSIQHVDMESLP